MVSNNKYRTLDLKGLEHAVLEDGCAIRIYRSNDTFFRIVKVISSNRINTLKGFGICSTLIPTLIQANNSYQSIEIESSDNIVETRDVDSYLDLWLLNGNKIVINKYNDQIRTSIVHYDNRIIFTVISESLGDGLDKANEWFATKDVDQYCTELLNENLGKQLYKKHPLII